MRRTRTTTNDEQRILTLLAFPHDTTTDHTGSGTSSSSSSMVFQVLGGLSLASSVGLGAYGAHGLHSRLAALEQAGVPPASTSALPQDVWSRANAYQQLHSVGLLLTPLLTQPGSTARAVAGSSFAAGIALFSGGLYASTFTGDKQLSKGAPFGGVAFMVGWVAIAVAGRRAPPLRV